VATGTSLVPEHAGALATVEELRLGDVSFYDLAEHFSDRSDFALLDSRTEDGGPGRFSFFSFAPFTRLISKGDRVAVGTDEGDRFFGEDPFRALEDILDRYRTYSRPQAVSMRFLGGGIGYLSYELGRRIEVLPDHAADELGLPDCYFCFYNFAVVLSREDGRVFLCHFEPASRRLGASKEWILAEIQQAEAGGYHRGLQTVGDDTAVERERFVADFTADAYVDAVRRIKELIFAGDVYQVNLTQRFRTDLHAATPWHLYKCLMAINPAPFAAYLNFENHVVISSSPERFLRVKDRFVETRPIKGTVKRGASPKEDAENREWLWRSAKNRAELAMIVDVLRNDLGRVSTPGSVRVNAFPELESYAAVHHLVATITGELAENRTVVDLIKATFPGGSVTGAPKIRAMEIIDELEPVTRGIYTGSIGYIGFNGTADLNIAIRTMIVQDGSVYIHAGGGIVADSNEKEEYEESLLKARKLFQAVQRAGATVGAPN
jgi:para-aminobenzoate synthetase component 1